MRNLPMAIIQVLRHIKSVFQNDHRVLPPATTSSLRRLGLMPLGSISGAHRFWALPFLMLLASNCPTTIPPAGTSTPLVLSTSALSTTTMSTDSPILIKDTNYPIPPDALYVATDGSDTNRGTFTAPFRTVTHAIKSAANNGMIVIRGGTYRESVTIDGKTLTLQPYPFEQVWFSGSQVVSGWIQDGARWRKDGWTPRFDYKLSADAIDPAYPLAGNADMVFVDGVPLKQVGSKAAVSPGTFYVDYRAAQLFIGDDPRGKTSEVAAQAQALLIRNAPGTAVRGLGFRHYATRAQHGAVTSNAPHVRIEDNTFAWNAAAGLSVVAPDNVVRGNSAVYNGQLGMHGHRAHRLLLEHNLLAHNNQERFESGWEAGGMKFVAAEDMIWRDNVTERNIGHGLWCDISCYNITIVRNTVRHNTSSGIEYEISAKALIAANLIVDNTFAGININESSDVDIYNNTLVRNEMNIRVVEGKRKNTDQQTRYLIPWDTGNVVIRNNILSNAKDGSLRMLLVDDYSGTANLKTGEQMVSALDHNAYYRSNVTTPQVAVLWSLGAKDGNYRSIEAVRRSIGQEHNGIGIDNVSANPFFVDEAAGNYHLRVDSGILNGGARLPPPIADILRLPPGVPVFIGAFSTQP